MSTAELIAETVFDADEPITRLGPESIGLSMTKEEFLAVDEWDGRYRYELIHGVVKVSPIPKEGERGPNEELGHWLRSYRDHHPQGAVLDDALYEHEFDTGPCVRRADRVIWAGLGRPPDAKRDVPTIVVEFVSQRRRDQRRDYEEKRAEYAAAGVKEYWIIDRFRRNMTVCCGENVTRVVRESETYTTELLPGFELPLAKLLAIADRWNDAGE